MQVILGGCLLKCWNTAQNNVKWINKWKKWELEIYYLLWCNYWKKHPWMGAYRDNTVLISYSKWFSFWKTWQILWIKFHISLESPCRWKDVVGKVIHMGLSFIWTWNWFHRKHRIHQSSRNCMSIKCPKHFEELIFSLFRIRWRDWCQMTVLFSNNIFWWTKVQFINTINQYYDDNKQLITVSCFVLFLV